MQPLAALTCLPATSSGSPMCGVGSVMIVMPMTFVVMLAMAAVMAMIMMRIGVDDFRLVFCGDGNACRRADRATDDGSVAPTHGGADCRARAASNRSAQHGSGINLPQAIRLGGRSRQQ